MAQPAEFGGRMLESEAWSVHLNQVINKQAWYCGKKGVWGVTHSTGPLKEVWGQHHTKATELTGI